MVAAPGLQVYPERPLRMVHLAHWLGHMWKRKGQGVNPNLDRSYAVVVASPPMTCGNQSAPPGITTGQQPLQPPASSQPVSSPTGGAPGFTPGVYQPVQAAQSYGTPGGFVPAQQPQAQQLPLPPWALCVDFVRSPKKTSCTHDFGSACNRCRAL